MTDAVNVFEKINVQENIHFQNFFIWPVGFNGFNLIA